KETICEAFTSEESEAVDRGRIQRVRAASTARDSRDLTHQVRGTGPLASAAELFARLAFCGKGLGAPMLDLMLGEGGFILASSRHCLKRTKASAAASHWIRDGPFECRIT
ncbi:hypothetical protein, partial [Mesorhizobium sp. M1D.F.Ca.ET.184.01.1.1]|uniref:hypothetical protein n=1 Tax=Mesorhizobium sp. M1D.F.Ca.ET.184.01.1.1 TaxID=2563931 RepID=UPI001AEDD556